MGAPGVNASRNSILKLRILSSFIAETVTYFNFMSTKII